MGMVVRLDMGPLLKLKANAAPKAGRIVGKHAFIIEGKAKFLVAKDTHALENSIMAKQIGELTWEVAPHTNYAWFQEFGTSRMPAHPYLVPATEGQRGAFETDMKDLFEP